MDVSDKLKYLDKLDFSTLIEMSGESLDKKAILFYVKDQGWILELMLGERGTKSAYPVTVKMVRFNRIKTYQRISTAMLDAKKLGIEEVKFIMPENSDQIK